MNLLQSNKAKREDLQALQAKVDKQESRIKLLEEQVKLLIAQNRQHMDYIKALGAKANG